MDAQSAIPVNTKIPTVIADTVDQPTSGLNEVQTGCTINGVFITIEGVASETSTTATPNVYVLVYKSPGQNLAIPNGNAVGASDNRKWIIHQEMVMINPVDGGNPRNLFKGVVVIPKHMRRMGPDDRLATQIFIPSTGVAMNVCQQFHYKEFR